MNHQTLNREAVRQLDRRAVEEYSVPSIVLMENAGRGVADKLCSFGIRGRVVICCGPGNNGGDGFVIARHLDLRGFDVEIFAWGCHLLVTEGQQLAGTPTDAQINLEIVRRSGLKLRLLNDVEGFASSLTGSNWVVDALLGTGARGEPRSPFDAVIDAVNAAAPSVLAVDLPSGLDCDTGQAAKHTICADHTCTFVAAKPGFFAPGATDFTGEVHVLDIGAPRVLVEDTLQKEVERG
jgi:NAD(P)H-hydrate epimerase